MSCRKLKAKARAEQDYWLSFSDFKDVTEEERLDFLRYDSHGGEMPSERVARFPLPDGTKMRGLNPIMLGKKRHGQLGNIKDGKRYGLMVDLYFLDGAWGGGLEMIEDYVLREPFGLRPLREWFGDESVEPWLRAFLALPWGTRGGRRTSAPEREPGHN